MPTILRPISISLRLISQTRSGSCSLAPEDPTNRPSEPVMSAPQLLAERISNAAIAERLTRIEYTVKTKNNLFAKLEVPNRTLAAAWAIEQTLRR
jgi:DNA-binding NarL/FixJ family response regulator